MGLKNLLKDASIAMLINPEIDSTPDHNPVEKYIRKHSLKEKVDIELSKWRINRVQAMRQVMRGHIRQRITELLGCATASTRHAIFAKRLTEEGMFDYDSDGNGMIGKCIEELSMVLATQRHSGGTVSSTIGLFMQLMGEYDGDLIPLAKKEIDRLATFILEEFHNEPGKHESESVVDVAIRLLSIRFMLDYDEALLLWCHQEVELKPEFVERAENIMTGIILQSLYEEHGGGVAALKVAIEKGWHEGL